jgi:hypothetical protein
MTSDPTPTPSERPVEAPEVLEAPELAPLSLPTLVRVSLAFSQRMPSQRVLDLMSRLEGAEFTALATTQPFRIIAFRALLRDYPGRDPASMWLHAYDVEVEVEQPNPTNGSTPTASLGSAGFGAVDR